MKWYPFDKAKGSCQKRPPERRHVLVVLAPNKDKSVPSGVAVGYRKNAAGDKQCPYFVVPGIGGEVIAWCDCLPDGFQAPCWMLPPQPSLEKLKIIKPARPQ
ncbi:MAG: hypothetical protein V4563_17780 [Pseudomonadota bacterium]